MKLAFRNKLQKIAERVTDVLPARRKLRPRGTTAWESEPGVPLDGATHCARLKDKSLNGNRELKDTLRHLETEPLVKWAFNPGTWLNGDARTAPPVGHAALIQAFRKWAAEGAPCPRE
ncbi:MAG: hypothetical protein L0Y50_09885 [Beijerinckiaceae bacterium]|nr:hypothetical protein [Beijerinckiaceae bacterium]